MDAVKFMKEYNRMCKSYFDKYNCEGCPLKNNYCVETNYVPENEISYEDVANTVKAWSKENPEEIGKKYIIEIDRIEYASVGDSDCSHKIYHVKNGEGFWVSEEYIAKLEEYKESEE